MSEFTYRVVDKDGREIGPPIKSPVAIGPRILNGVTVEVVEVKEPAPGQTQGTVVVTT